MYLLTFLCHLKYSEYYLLFNVKYGLLKYPLCGFNSDAKSKNSLIFPILRYVAIGYLISLALFQNQDAISLIISQYLEFPIYQEY